MSLATKIDWTKIEKKTKPFLYVFSKDVGGILHRVLVSESSVSADWRFVTPLESPWCPYSTHQEEKTVLEMTLMDMWKNAKNS